MSRASSSAVAIFSAKCSRPANCSKSSNKRAGATAGRLGRNHPDYGPQRADEVCSFEVNEYPVPTKTNPLSVRGAGEAGNVGALAAIINAVVDALSPLGITHNDIPATPEPATPEPATPEPATPEPATP